MMYVFYDYNGQNDIVFTSEKKAKDFVRKFKHWWIDNDESGIVDDADYILEKTPVDTPFEEWIKEYGYHITH